ncbi:MAG: sodium:proline symporter, partial [Elusimicrobia bacterium]|nr:sodium:proline symporter [Elusimicrobiota bacterium]
DSFKLDSGSKLFFKPGDTVAAKTVVAEFGSDFFKVVMKMVSFAWGGFGAAFGPLILLALFWRRTNLAGAVSGMVVGAATCFAWKFWLSPTYAKI